MILPRFRRREPDTPREEAADELEFVLKEVERVGEGGGGRRWGRGGWRSGGSGGEVGHEAVVDGVGEGREAVKTESSVAVVG